MGPFDIEPSGSVVNTGADREADDAPPAGNVGDAGSTSLEPSPVDIIGRGLIRRHYGTVYNQTSIIDAPTSPPAAVEPVVDLRTPSPRRSRLLRARWRAFTTYWRGDLLSMIGDHFTIVALPFAADRLTHSGFDVGVVVSVEGLATVVFGTMAGTFADRRRPRPLMITCDLVRAGILAALAVLDLTHHSMFAALVVAALILGALRLLSDGGRSTLVADLVPDELDIRSNNRLVLSENIGAAVGPALAGLVIAGGLWRAFGIDGFSFVCSAVAIAVVGRAMRRGNIPEHRPQAANEREPVSYLEESRRALAAIRDDVVFRRALVVASLFNITTLPLGGQFVTLARHTLHMAPWLIGLIYAAGGVSGIVTAPLVERDRAIRPGVLPIAAGAAGAAMLLVGLAPSAATTTIAFVVGGASFTSLLTHWSALRQRRFPVDQQGRVTLTARRVMFVPLLVGPLLGGWLSDAVNPAALWLAAGASGLAAAVWGLAVGLHHERYD